MHDVIYQYLTLFKKTILDQQNEEYALVILGLWIYITPTRWIISVLICVNWNLKNIFPSMNFHNTASVTFNHYSVYYFYHH